MKLSIVLEALTGSFETDMKRAAKATDQAARDMEARFAKVGAVIGTAIAAAVVTVSALTKAAIDNADAMSNMAQKVGIGTEALSALAYQAKLADVELSALQTGLTKFNRLIVDAASGDKGAQSFFKTIGVDIRDLAGSLRPTEQILSDVAERFAGYEDGAAKAALAVKGFGKAGADMIPFLNEGEEGMKRAAKEAEAFGIIVSDAGGKAADQFNDNIEKMTTATGGLFNQIAERITPALAEMSGKMVEGATQGQALAKVADVIATALKGVITGLVYIKNGLEIAAAQFTGFVLGAKALFSGIGDYAEAAGAYIGEQIRAAFTLDPAMADKSSAIFADRLKKIGAAVSIELQTASKLVRKSVDDQMRDIEVSMRALWGSSGASPDAPAGGGRKLTEAPIVPEGMEAAAAAAAKAAKEVERLRDTAADSLTKLGDLGSSLEAFLDPMDESAAKLGEDLENIRRQTEETVTAIDALRASAGGDEEEAATQRAQALEYESTAIANATAAHEQRVMVIEQERDVTGRFIEELSEQAKLYGMNARQARVEAVVLAALAEAKKKNAAAGKEVVKIDEQRLRQQALMNAKMEELDAVVEQFSDPSGFGELQSQIELVEEAMEGAFGKPTQERMAELKRAMEGLNAQVGMKTLGSFKALLGAMQTFTKEGSAGFKNIEKGMAALQIVQDLIAIRAAVIAVLTQGEGEPYSAWARMAAMAAAVAPFLASIGASLASFGGGGGGPSADSAEVRQMTQGTGSILGDDEAKSESIANAIEITAEATSELVGISRGMLNALQAMRAGISGASAGIARVEFGDLSLSGNAFEGAFGPLPTIGEALLGSIFGGKQKLIDQGIRIVGGTLSDMIENIMASSYQTIETSGGWFSGDDTDDEFEALSERTTTQLRLVLQSISDAVSEGAEALGLNMEEINAAIAAFRIEEIRISTMDLTGEEAQAELEAVFSTIFDDLAGDVVPFIEQFQRVGEGLGETLVRVATGVQVTREAIRYLGLAIDEADPERFAQISEGLIEAVGGIDQFITGLQQFTAAFADDQHRLQVATSELNDAFAEAGLLLPETAEGMWDLMQSLDATTAEGQEQIATLLRLAGTAREYYDLIEKAEQARLDYVLESAEVRAELGIDGGGFVAARAQIEDWTTTTIEALNDLARAAGRAGAAETDLVNVHRVAAQRVAQLIARLNQEARDIAATLGYVTASSSDTLESLNAEIENFGSTVTDVGGAVGDAVDSMREKMNLLLGDLSPFNDQRKLELALQGLREGTVDPQQVLEIGRRLYASTSNYTALFDQVMGMARFGTPGNDGGATETEQSEQTRTLAELIAARDALLESQSAGLAEDLARRIAELAYATGDDFATVAAGIGEGFELDVLAEDLGLSIEELGKLLQSYFDQVESQDMAAAAEVITDAINRSADRIVEALGGDIGGDKEEEAEARRSEQYETASDKLREEVATVRQAVQSLTSAVLSDGEQTREQLSGDLQSMGRESRELRLGVQGNILTQRELRMVGA